MKIKLGQSGCDNPRIYKKAFFNLKKEYKEYRDEMEKYLKDTNRWLKATEEELRDYKHKYRFVSIMMWIYFATIMLATIILANCK